MVKRWLFWMVPLLVLFGSSVGEAAWQEKWQNVLKAAKKEGVVAVSGPAGVQSRDSLTKPFEDKYGIRVNFFWRLRPGAITAHHGRTKGGSLYVGCVRSWNHHWTHSHDPRWGV